MGGVLTYLDFAIPTLYLPMAIIRHKKSLINTLFHLAKWLNPLLRLPPMIISSTHTSSCEFRHPNSHRGSKSSLIFSNTWRYDTHLTHLPFIITYSNLQSHILYIQQMCHLSPTDHSDFDDWQVWQIRESDILWGVGYDEESAERQGNRIKI